MRSTSKQQLIIDIFDIIMDWRMSDDHHMSM